MIGASTILVKSVTTIEGIKNVGSIPVARSAPDSKPSALEAVLVVISVLAALTALLVRLPYRAPLVNGLLTGVGLSFFYGYFRYRLNIKLPRRALLCLAISVVIDIIGNQYGLFSKKILFIPYDSITHFAISGLSLVAVMWMLMAIIRRFGYQLPLGFIAFFSATTVFSLSAYYEITELLDERLLEGHRIWTPRDTSQDLAADLAGIILATVVYTIVIRRRIARMIHTERFL